MAHNGTDEHSMKPKKWWQWFLLYPAFAIAALGAIPTYIELYNSQEKGVGFGDSKRALMRNEMWRKNMTCGMAPLDPLITPSNVAVDATICKSGDILIRVTTPDNKKYFEWVAVENIFSPNMESASFSFFKNAVASEVNHNLQLAQYGPQVLCQNWINRVMIVRRVFYPGRGCFDETINTYTGQIVNVISAPCSC